MPAFSAGNLYHSCYPLSKYFPCILPGWSKQYSTSQNASNHLKLRQGKHEFVQLFSGSGGCLWLLGVGGGGGARGVGLGAQEVLAWLRSWLLLLAWLLLGMVGGDGRKLLVSRVYGKSGGGRKYK